MTTDERILHLLALSSAPFTIAELAYVFKVPRRDIEAAIESLRLAGNPVIADGRGGFKGNVELSRLAVHPEFSTERSKVIRRVLAVAAADLDWVFAYADPKAGHHGGIYQALGAIYCGLSPSYTGWRATDGTMLHPRSAVSTFGTQAQEAMTARGYEAVPAAFGGLHTYIIPIRHNEALKLALAPYVRAYPKRGAA
jgi:biotin operon repressor